MLVKLYGEPPGNFAKRKYSPVECCGTITSVVCGDPDPQHISTSFVERQNPTMRMSMRRLVENLEHAVALHLMHYITKPPDWQFLAETTDRQLVSER